jgi:serine/threonine protein kinase
MNLTAEAAINKGNYVLHEQLGKGVLTCTYRATNAQSGQTVVIKTLTEKLRQHSDFEQFKQQFLDFGNRLKPCQHPNLVQVLDLFEDAGYPYLVMEYIPGKTLAELIQAGVLPPVKAIRYIRQVGNALRVLHKAGLLHRDVKPENIIRHQDSDRVVLVEFGIAGEFLPGMLQTQANLLSAGYAPLEQYSFQEERTPATDIYGLAATLYYLLYRTPPIAAPVRQVLQAQGNKRLFPANSSQIAPNLSTSVKRAIWYGLELTPHKRPQTVETWLSLLCKSVKKPTPKSSLAQCLVTQHKAGQKVPPQPHIVKQKVQSAVINSKTSEPLAPEKNPTPKLPGLQPWSITQSHTVVKSGSTTSTKLNPPSTNEAKLISSAKVTPHKLLAREKINDILHLLVASRNLKGRDLLLRALLMTGAIAASAGLGFGFAIRINGPREPGSTILHTEQSFPPRSDWPGLERQL